MATKVLTTGTDVLRPRHFVCVDQISAVTDRTHILFDSRVLLPPDRFLIEKIDREGFTSALLVRPDGSQAYQLIAGRRRRRACVELIRIYAEHGIDVEFEGPRDVVDSVFGAMTLHGKGLDRSKNFVGVWVEIRNVGDAEAYDLMVGENMAACPYTDFQIAELVQRATEIPVRIEGVIRVRTMVEACRPFNISTTRGYALLSLLRADDVVQTQVAENRLDVSAAAALASMPREEQRRVVQEAADKGKRITTDKARVLARPEGPLPQNLRIQILKKVVTTAEILAQVRGSAHALVTLLFVLTDGDEAELENDDKAKAAFMQAKAAVLEASGKRGKKAQKGEDTEALA